MQCFFSYVALCQTDVLLDRKSHSQRICICNICNPYLVSCHLCGCRFGFLTRRHENIFCSFFLLEVYNRLYSSIVIFNPLCASEYFGELLKTLNAWPPPQRLHFNRCGSKHRLWYLLRPQFILACKPLLSTTTG